jgi:valyl-tRNA synthetase
MASPSPDFPTQYDPRAHEDAVYERWEQAGVFGSHAGPGKPYTIVIPPPNITGALHIGHALNNSLQDLLIRWRRMQGYEALWLPGTDHAGIATQNVVEKAIAKTEGKSRYQLGRAELLKRIWAWREQYGGTILKQLRKLGASCDWTRTRFTLDEGLSRAVRTAFVRLHEKGLLYRGKYLVNWCPRCRTTLSDDEVEHEEVKTHIWEIHYPLSGAARLTVATTRPETMLGDTAVAVHPQDERYRAFVGKTVELPLTGRRIPVIADNALELGFGTGCLKVTPAHDPVDYQIALRHKLPMINILTEDGRLNENAPEAFRGLECLPARKAVLAALKAQGLLGNISDYKHQVGHCYRCHTMVEPFLTSQWFVSMKPLSELAVKATAEGRVRFHPERWTKVYLQWFREIRDWPISRQIWWGHQIPAWYCLEDNAGAITKIEAGPDEPFDAEEGGKKFRYLIGENAKPIVSADDPATLPPYRDKTLIRDPDVLDTWFSSALWPFSTLGWPDRTKDLGFHFPTDTLVTDRSIIYFWVARMVMMGEFCMGREPFRDVVIHGTVLDGEGAKMSKSAGNSIDPLDIIERYGADAMRFTIFDMATEGQDIRFPVLIVCPHCGETQDLPKKRSLAVMKCRKCKMEFQQPVPNEPSLPEPVEGHLDSKRFEKGRNFANKVWNAARFVLTSVNPADVPKIEAAQVQAALRDEDRWILSRLNHAAREVTEALEGFEFAKAAGALYTFFWDDFCAWTIELSKPRLSAENAAADRAAATAVLLHVLDRSLRLLHPFCPFITEVLWGELAKVAPAGLARNLGRPEQCATAGLSESCATAGLSSSGRAPGRTAGQASSGTFDLLAVAPWPVVEEASLKPELEDQFGALFEAIRATRNIRQKNGIAPKARLKVFIRTTDPAAEKRLKSGEHILVQMANIEPPEIGPEVEKPRPAGHEVLQGADLYVALSGLIDVEKERARLTKEIERAQNGVQGSERKLADPKFTAHAPPELVKEEKARLAEYQEKVAKLKEALEELV